MNITEQGLREYLEVFHATLQETADQFIDDELQHNLFHLSLLPAHVVGYISTQYGVAIEYKPSNSEGNEKTVIEINRGSARVEDLLFQAPRRLRKLPPFIALNNTKNTRLIDNSFEGRLPFRLRGPESSLFIENLKVSAGTWNRVLSYAEVFGNRTRANWSREKAVSKAKDEVLAALDEIRRSEAKGLSVADYISMYKSKTVLVLGDYSNSGEERLNRISSHLTELGYEPLLVKDVPDYPAYDLRQKVVAMGAVARFVIIDDSSRSGHLMEVQICDQNHWVTILLRAEGQGGSYMTAGGSHFSNVILEKDYATANPRPAIIEATNWAEDKLKELQRALDATYPWRNINS